MKKKQSFSSAWPPSRNTRSISAIVRGLLKKAAKNVVKKAEQTVTNKAEQTVKKTVGDVVSTGSKTNGSKTNGSTANGTTAGGSRTSKLPVAAAFGGANHTALFAPVGTPLDAKWGVKAASVSKPPKHDADQPDWNDTRPTAYELDNKSLVDEYIVLRDCMDSNYISHNGPAAIRYFSVLEELSARTKMLDRMVQCYDDTNDCLSDDDPDERAFGPGWVDTFIGILKTREYKIVLRSSLATFATLNEVTKQNWLKKRTLEYFQQYGGFENAHKAKWTVVKSMKK